MKRSEAVKLIIRNINDLDYGDASFILELLENKGMLPPARKQEHMINENYYTHEWEEE